MGKMTIGQMIAQLGSGMLISTQIFVITLLFSLPLGLVVAFGRMSKNRVISMIVKFYISIMRGTPLMLQLMVVYFGPYYLFHIKVGSSYRLTATFIGFVINYAAYFAEIYRSGIQSMPVGQYEAAQILGYNKAQTFFKIILPQVIKRILPSITNEVITLVKDTSLAFTLSVAEMFSIAKALAASQTNMIPFVAAAIFYYVFNYVVAFIMEFFEKKEPNRLHRITEWAVDCAVMVALACYLVFCFGSRIEMNGSSMKPVLESGDVVLINRLSYDVGKPVRFDVVVFEREEQQPGIKRIIGLPGETVQIKNGSVYINGELLKAENGLAEATISGAAEYPVELGDDEYFLLGDNRESSEDSRFSGIGNIKRENLIGRVWLRFQPFSRLGFVR